MAEIIPFEPDPGNAGVGSGKKGITNRSHAPEVKKGRGFFISRAIKNIWQKI